MRSPGKLIFHLMILMPLAGGVAGRLAAPGLARFNTVVRVAEEVRRDEVRSAERGVRNKEKVVVQSVEEAKEVKAFKETGMPVAMLYDEARATARKFETGSIWLGAWCGLVAALKIGAELRARRPREYETDGADCLACARCYQSCPVERERLEKQLGERAL